VVVQSGPLAAGWVDIVQLIDGVGELAKTWQQAHGLGGLEAGSEEVDHEPLPADAAGPLNQLHVPARAIQQAGEGEACDAGAADQRTHGEIIKIVMRAEPFEAQDGACRSVPFD
jgi:hypothetical protein